MGMTDVACFIVGAELSFVTMTSTLRLTNSAAISSMRSGRPSDQRYSKPLAARAEQAERTRRIGGRRKTCHLKSGRREE
jgi:hypothetical protein